MLVVRPCQACDVPVLNAMIHEFAAFDRLPIALTEEDLLRDGFSDEPRFRALIAEWDTQPAGYAFFFNYYSNFQRRHGMFLEDVYMRAQFRGKGIGKVLLARAAVIAQQENCFGLCWEVLDWNTPAINFYRKLGVTFLDEWKSVSLEGEAARRLAKSE